MDVKIGYSELILLDHPVEENVARLAEAGADSVELMMDASGWDSLGEDYGPLADRLRATGITFTVHPAAWDVNLAAEMHILREAAYRHHQQALAFAARLGAEQMVLHPGYSTFDKERARELAHRTVCDLAQQAAACGVRLAFENIAGPAAALYTQEAFCHALDETGPSVGYLLDIGHANMNGWNIPEVIRTLGNRLLGLHLHDNLGVGDDHLPVGQGSIQWAPIWAAAAESCTDACHWILEYAPGTPLHWLTQTRESIRRVMEQY